MRISRRLAKLEYALPPARTVERTREEERILHYEVARAFVELKKFPALHDRLAAYADHTAAEICRKRALPRTDQYRDHIDYVEEMWVVSGRVLPFIPPVVGSTYDEWFLPGLAERRLAVRRRPSVIALIGDTASSASWWHSTAPDEVMVPEHHPRRRDDDFGSYGAVPSEELAAVVPRRANPEQLSEVRQLHEMLRRRAVQPTIDPIKERKQ